MNDATDIQTHQYAGTVALNLWGTETGSLPCVYFTPDQAEMLSEMLAEIAETIREQSAKGDA